MRISYKKSCAGYVICCWLFIFLLIFITQVAPAQAGIAEEIIEYENERTSPRGMVVRVEGTITSGTARMLQSSLEEVEAEGYDFLLVELDTPGGVLDPTLKIMSDFLEAPVPIITYVSPSGAISASAGSFLLISGHKAAMTPGTSTGAAMPVEFSPGGEQRGADEKTVNFLAGHVKSVAQDRGRNAEVAEKFVTENLTLTADEARDENIIDAVSRTRDELLVKLDGQTVVVRGEERELKTKGAELTFREMGLWESLENILGNPQVTFLLLLVGVYGLIIGFSSPGTIVPEVGGAIALLMALYGLGIIEVDYLGLLLVGLGVVFLIVELFTPTFGIFTTLGVIMLVLGGFLFPGEPLLPAEWFQNFRMLVLGVAVMTALFILVILKKLLDLRNLDSDDAGKRGKLRENVGIVVDALDPEGQVKYEGELWRARLDGGQAERGEKVKIKEREGMVLLAEKMTEESEENQN